MKKLIITGNVGQDAQVITTESGHSFAKFSLAVSVGAKDHPKTDWVQVMCNNKTVEFAKNHVKKGCKLLVEGFPEATAYIKDGVPAATLRVYASSIELFTWAEKDAYGNDVITEATTTSEVPLQT